MQKGVFTISLDFELYWGVRDHRRLEQYGDNISGVWKVVPRLLQLFEKYEVHGTWATVGFLFFNNKKELLENFPHRLPEYRKKEYDPYAYIRQQELDPRYHFAPELIDRIQSTPGQEIGTHTFSHFYTLEKNTTAPQFRDDLEKALQVARQKGHQIDSIVFPRNQYAEEHIRICRELGIKVYRGNESSKVYKPLSRENENLLRRILRFADTYINLTGHHGHPLPARESIINIPASRFLRPYHPALHYLDPLKLSRIRRSMERAADRGHIYQLWWHPHNFGRYMEQNFQFLEKVLNVYRQLNREGKMESLSLREIYQRTPGN